MWIVETLITNTKFCSKQSSDECYVAESMILCVNTHPMSNVEPETRSLCQS